MTPQALHRWLVPITILSMLLLLIAIGSAWHVRNLQKTESDQMAGNVASVRAAQELEINIRKVRTQFDRYLITQDDTHLKSIPRLKQRTEDSLIEAERAATTPTEQILMKQARQGYDHFFAEFERILADRDHWKFPKIIELIDTVLEKEILEPAHEYLRVNDGMLTRASETNQKLADRLTTGMFALGLFGTLGGLLGGTVIAIAVRRSIQRTEDRVRSTAEQLDLAANRGQPATPGQTRPTRPADPLEQMSLSASAILNRLERTERDALRAEQLAWVGQMAAGIAHEIRNPLMSIKLLVQATTDRRSRSMFQNRDLQVLEEEIVRLEHIVSGFLDFARPPRMEPRQFDVCELVGQVVGGMTPRSDLQGVPIRVEHPSGPCEITADPNQLRQVVYNLLFNALDAQPHGGGITIRIRRTFSNETQELVLEVDDSGPGIPVDLAERIFEPFVSTKETGMGLGLSICRRIVETHGGSLTVDSSPAGSVFTVRLPLGAALSPAANVVSV
jgi:two-component system, NtrC family, sensor histidine kinase HydH